MLNFSINSLLLDIPIDINHQLQEIEEAVHLDTSDFGIDLMEATGATDFQLNQLLNTYQEPDAVDNVTLELSDVSSPPTEQLKSPECPICYEPYTDTRRCYTICLNGHSLCEACKEPSTSAGRCPICNLPDSCLASGILNLEVMNLVRDITAMNNTPEPSSRSALSHQPPDTAIAPTPPPAAPINPPLVPSSPARASLVVAPVQTRDSSMTTAVAPFVGELTGPQYVSDTIYVFN